MADTEIQQAVVHAANNCTSVSDKLKEYMSITNFCSQVKSI